MKQGNCVGWGSWQHFVSLIRNKVFLPRRKLLSIWISWSVSNFMQFLMQFVWLEIWLTWTRWNSITFLFRRRTFPRWQSSKSVKICLAAFFRSEFFSNAAHSWWPRLQNFVLIKTIQIHTLLQSAFKLYA